MAKKIRQQQVENLSEDLLILNNKKVKSLAFTGTTTKTLTVTFEDDTTLTTSFVDNDTTYPGLTATLLNDGIDTQERTIQAKILSDYINARLSTVFVLKGTVADFNSLPTSGQKVGETWNVAAAFVYLGESYPAGTNVAWNGTDWDPLAGFIDTSVFLTQENDPKGVAAINITGTDTKTITITLRDNSTITGTFTDKDTTYSKGTLSDLQTGTDTTGKVWGADTLAAFVNSLQIIVRHESIVILAGMISSGNVNLTPSAVITDKNRVLVFLNGVKQPLSSYSMVSNVLRLTQSSLPTPIIAGDEVELFYI